MSEIYPVHEKSNESHDNSHELRRHHERLSEHHEKSAEKAKHGSHEQERARHEAHEQAISGSEYQKPQAEKRQPAQTAYNSKADKLRSFNTTMHHVRNELSTPERTLSKIIHRPAVEKASEIIGATVARPSGIAGATIAAFIGLLSVYSVAKFAGFELSGSEMPLLLAVGFVIGLFTEWVYKSIKSILGKNTT